MTSSLFRFIVGLVKDENLNEPIYNLKRGLFFPFLIFSVVFVVGLGSYFFIQNERMGMTVEIGMRTAMIFLCFIVAPFTLIYALSVKVYIFEEELQIKFFSKLLKIEFKNVSKMSLAPVYGYMWPFGKIVIIYSGNIGLSIPFFFFSDGEDAIN